MLNGLDLFSGIGGISYALRDYIRPVAYCEIDPYCQGVLLSRMADGSLSNAPIWDTVTTLQGLCFSGIVDIIYGGFPCQDISIARNGKGLDGQRSGLFFEIMRLAKEIKPTFLFIENVPAIRSRGGERVLGEIAKLGYDSRFCIISAASCGAPHKRERWFLLAYSGREQERSQEKSKWSSIHTTRCVRDWEDKPPIYRMDDGLPCWVDRNKSLGNAVVPAQAKKAFEILMGLDKTN